MEPFTNLEKEVLFEFLKELGTRFENDGCNDFRLPDTGESRRLFENIVRHRYPMVDADFMIESCPNGPFFTMNIDALDYLVKKLERVLK